MKKYRFQYLLAGFSIQAFLALAWTASISSGGSFLLGFTKARLVVLALLLILGIATLALSVLLWRKPQLDQTVDQFISNGLVGHNALSSVLILLVVAAVCCALPLIALLPGMGNAIVYQFWRPSQSATIIAVITRLSPILLMAVFLFLESVVFISILYRIELSSEVNEIRLKLKHYINSLGMWMQSTTKSITRPALLAFLITGVFFAVFLLLFRVSYGATDDDPQIISLLSGYGGNTPTAYTIYTNYIFAYPLMLLYRLHTSINWLMVFLAGTIFLSIWALLYLFLRSKNFRKADLFIAIIFILAITGYLLMHITYTMEAGMTIVTGLFLLSFSGMSDEKAKPAMLIAGVLLVVLGSFIRLEALVPPLVVFLPIWAIHIRSLLRNRACLAALGAAAVFVLAGVIINDAIYASNPAWNDFRTYSNARSQIQDTLRLSCVLSSSPEKLDSIHWSKNDAKMLGIWFFPDQNIYSLENFQFLNSEFPHTQQSILKTWNSFITPTGNTYIFPYLLLMLSTFPLLIAVRPKKKHILSTTLSLLGAIGLFSYMAWSMKLVDRVTFPPLVAISLLNLLFWCIDHQPNDQLENLRKDKITSVFIKLITAAIVIFSLVMIGEQDFYLSNLNAVREDIYSRSLSDIDALVDKGIIPQDSLFLGPNRGFPIEWSNPFLLDFPRFHYVIMDWITNSPVFEETMKKNGIQSLVSALYQKNNVFLFASEGEIPIVEQYILEHDGVKVTEKIVYTAMTDSIFDYHDSHLYQFYTK